MNLLISIFGGMLMTVLLYGVARKLRLSNFWAAVLGSAIPSFAYLGYAIGVWPGLDVVTIHVITYPTIAVLLFNLYGDKGGRPLSVHWAPKLLIGFFVLITLLMGGFVYIAGQGLPPVLARLLLPGADSGNVHTGFAGVVAHGEDAAKSISHRRGMDARLARLGWRVEVSGLDALRPGLAGRIGVAITGAEGLGVDGVTVDLLLGRPGQASEKVIHLSGQGGGQYFASMALPGSGVWLATLRLQAGAERIVLERKLGGE